MLKETRYIKLLDLIYENYEKGPPHYTGKVEIEQRIDMPAESFLPYLNRLMKEGYLKKMEGYAPTFIVKFTEKGYRTYQEIKR